MRKHGACNDIADGADRGDVGLEVLIDDDATAVVELNSDGLCANCVQYSYSSSFVQMIGTAKAMHARDVR